MSARIIKLFDPTRPRRIDARTMVPLKFVAGSNVLVAEDWSLGGFRTRTNMQYQPGHEFTVSHIIGTDETPVPVNERALVVRANAQTGETGIRFLGLADNTFRLLERAMMSRRA